MIKAFYMFVLNIIYAVGLYSCIHARLHWEAIFLTVIYCFALCDMIGLHRKH